LLKRSARPKSCCGEAIKVLIQTTGPDLEVRLRGLLLWVRQHWIWFLVAIGFLVLVFTQASNLRRVVATLIQGQVIWLVAAVLLQVAYYLDYALLYKFSFAAAGVMSRWFGLIPVLFASMFLKAVVPTGGLSSLVVFVDDAIKRGQSGARALEGSLLVLVADLAMTIPFIAFGLGYLYVRGVLQPYQAIVSALFVLFAAALVVLLLLGRFRPESLRGVFKWVQGLVNGVALRFGEKPLVPPDWAENQAREYICAACDIAGHSTPVIYTLGVALAAHIINVASLYAVSVAYRYPLPLGAAVAAFALDIVFSVINIIPHGLGVAEGIMALVFISLSIPTATSVAITIVFRGFNVWLPVIVGSSFAHRLQALGRSSNQGRGGGDNPS